MDLIWAAGLIMGWIVQMFSPMVLKDPEITAAEPLCCQEIPKCGNISTTWCETAGHLINLWSGAISMKKRDCQNGQQKMSTVFSNDTFSLYFSFTFYLSDDMMLPTTCWWCMLVISGHIEPATPQKRTSEPPASYCVDFYCKCLNKSII